MEMMEKKMPKIITIVNTKGGAGKTTTVVNLARYLAEDYKVAVADSDPQKSSSNWFAKKPTKFKIESASFKQIHALLANPSKLKLDFIIIDTPAGLSEQMLKILALGSDLIIVPSKTSMLDIEPTIRLTKVLKDSQVKYKVLLTQIPAHAKNSVAIIKTVLYQRDIPFFKTVMRQLEANVMAAINRTTVFEMGYEGRAARLDYKLLAREVEALFEEQEEPKAELAS